MLGEKRLSVENLFKKGLEFNHAVRISKECSLKQLKMQIAHKLSLDMNTFRFDTYLSLGGNIPHDLLINGSSSVSRDICIEIELSEFTNYTSNPTRCLRNDFIIHSVEPIIVNMCELENNLNVDPMMSKCLIPSNDINRDYMYMKYAVPIRTCLNLKDEICDIPTGEPSPTNNSTGSPTPSKSALPSDSPTNIQIYNACKSSPDYDIIFIQIIKDSATTPIIGYYDCQNKKDLQMYYDFITNRTDTSCNNISNREKKISM
eukprot:184763_1